MKFTIICIHSFDSFSLMHFAELAKHETEKEKRASKQNELANVKVSEKNMSDLYFFRKVIFFLKQWRKHLEKFNFCSTYNGAQKHERCIGFKNASFRARTYVILASLNYVDCLAYTDNPLYNDAVCPQII